MNDIIIIKDMIINDAMRHKIVDKNWSGEVQCYIIYNYHAAAHPICYNILGVNLRGRGEGG